MYTTSTVCVLFTVLLGFAIGADLECPKGWIYRPNDKNCYRAQGTTKSGDYFDALAHCQEMGGVMPAPKTKELNNFLLNVTKSQLPAIPFNQRYIWLPLRISNVTQTWQWEDGESLSWTNWMGRYPHKTVKEDYCAWMDENGEWRDFMCYLIFHHICSKPASSFLTTTTTSTTTTSATTTSTTTPPTTTPGGLCVYHPCKNGATCVYNDVTHKTTCICADGFSGEQCTQRDPIVG